MRGYIFTEWERERINEFLDQGTTPDGLPTIKTRMYQNLPRIVEDIKLGFEFWSALKNEASTELRELALDSHMWYLEHLRETSADIPEMDIDDVQRELLSKNMIYQAALESAYCGVMILNPDNEIVYVNKTMAEVAGRSKKSMIGKKPEIFLQAKEGYIEWLTKQVIERGRFKHTVYTEVYDKWVEIEAATIVQGGVHVASVACVRDVTVRKNLELQVKELLDQLTSTTRGVV
jgi:PAS domain S-box-containing protein